MNVWQELSFFRRDENWGNPDLMNSGLLLLLDDFRFSIDSPCVVTSGTGGKHTPNSYHYRGKAVDIVLPWFRGTALDLILTALRFPFGGIGYYPHWQFKGKKVGGLHLDTRPILRKRRKLWMGVQVISEGNTEPYQAYIGLTESNLRKFGVI